MADMILGNWVKDESCEGHSCQVIVAKDYADDTGKLCGKDATRSQLLVTKTIGDSKTLVTQTFLCQEHAENVVPVVEEFLTTGGDPLKRWTGAMVELNNAFLDAFVALQNQASELRDENYSERLTALQTQMTDLKTNLQTQLTAIEESENA